MNAAKLMAGLAGLGAAAAVGVAISQHRIARAAEEELAVARAARAALQVRVAATEKKVPVGERRAREAERDSGELLQAVEAVKAAEAPRPVSVNPAIVGRAGSLPTSGTVGGNETDLAEKERLAYERAYAQQSAKRRAEELKRRAELAQDLLTLDPAQKFDRRVAAAEQLVAKGDFRGAMRIYNDALVAKPADLPVTEKGAQLLAVLTAQKTPVNVTLVSDGATFVFIPNVQAVGKIQVRVVNLYPGDYEVFGVRQGYESESKLLQVRNGAPPPEVSVTCTRPLRN